MDAFLTISTQGSIVILAVAALRLMLKKAPKRFVCLLWLLAGMRLLLPFQIESSLSLQPRREAAVFPAIRQETEYVGGYGEILNEAGEVLVEKPLRQTSRGEILNEQGEILVVKPLKPNGELHEGEQTANWKSFLPYIWLLGVCAMTASSLVAYLRLRKRVADSVIFTEGVWVTGNIDTAFVLGFFRPEVYLPTWLTEDEREFVLAHERSHIARRDYWWKLLGYITLSLHWFNPLVWLGYVLLCRDLEMACDEAVVKTMDLSRRKAYSAALVSCSAVHPAIAACPVAFGEVCVKERVKRVLNFKKPGFWITLAAVLAGVFVAVFLLTSPGMTDEEILQSLYQQIQEFQNSEEKHVVLTIEMDSEFDKVTSQRQEQWSSGEDWYLHIDYETPMGSFVEGYMQLDGIQYAMDHSEEIEEFEDRPWAQIPEKNYVKESSIYTKDFSKLEVLEIREKAGEDGGKYTIVLKDDMAVDAPEKIYEATYTFRLDGKGKLLGITRYTHQNVYMSGFGLEGYFDTKSQFVFEILDFDEAEFTQKMNGAMNEVAKNKTDRGTDSSLGTATIVEEDKEFDIFLGTATIIEFDEAEKQMIDQCREAVEAFQSRDSVCVMVENQFGGDILNDSSNVEYYQNDDNWLIRSVIENSDFRQVWLGAEVDGQYQERESYDLADPANGEDWDTGWVDDLDGEPGLPWLCTVKWENLLVTDAKMEHQENLTWYHLVVFGPPYEMAQEVKEYKLTFVFQGDVFRKVILEYDMTWNGGRGHVVSTITPKTMLPEEIEGYIRQVWDYVTK